MTDILHMTFANVFLVWIFNIIWWTKHNSTQTKVTLQISSKSADGMDRFFVGERPGGTPNTVASHESRCLISPTIRLFLKSLFRLTTHETSKLSIIGPMLGNHRSSVDSPNKWPATREAFWCHRVMMQAQSCHNSGALCVWARDKAVIQKVDGRFGRMIGRAIIENYTSHMVSNCCNM